MAQMIRFAAAAVLAAIVCLLLVISIVLAFLSIDVIRQLDVQRFLGQNYSTEETAR